MPEDLLDKCRLDLLYFWKKDLGMKHSFANFLKGNCSFKELQFQICSKVLLFLLEQYHQISQAVLAATGMNGLTILHWKCTRSDIFDHISPNRVIFEKSLKRNCWTQQEKLSVKYFSKVLFYKKNIPVCQTMYMECFRYKRSNTSSFC